MIFLLVLVASSCKETPQEAQETLTFKNKENIVYVRLPGEPDRLNPLLTTSVYARGVHEQIFQNLLAFDSESLELTPQLAKTRPIIEEISSGDHQGKIAYSFEIQDAAVWDNGSPITGKDVAFTLKTIMNPKVNAGPYRGYFDFVDDLYVDSENPKKFTFYTNKKYILAEDVLSNFSILPAYIYDPEGLMESFTVKQLIDSEKAEKLAASNPALQKFAEAFHESKFSRDKGFLVGSGPYEFEEWETGQRIILKRKSDWWAKNLKTPSSILKSYPEQIIYKIVPDQTAALSGLKDEAFDVTAQIDSKDFTELKANEIAGKLFNLHTPPSMSYYYIGINNKNPKLADKRVRRALAHLMDIDELINNLYYGLAKRVTGPVNPKKKYYHKGLKPIEFDVEKAKALLKEAGWEDSNGNGVIDKEIDGEQVEFSIKYLTTNGSKFGRNMALLLQDNAKKAGIELELDAKQFPVLTADLKQRNYELYGSGWVQDPTLDDFKQIWHTESDTPDGSNRVSFGNAKSDALIDEIRTTLDEKKRNELYLEFQELLYEEQPYIFLFSPLERIAIHKRFEAKPSQKRPGFFPNEFIHRDIAMN